MTRPNVFVVGAPKAGSTSIHNYFQGHPDIFVPSQKELHFFSHRQLMANAAGPGDAYALRSIVRSKSEYERHFRASCQSVNVDVSPSYLYYDEVANDIATFSPTAKILVLLRDPVERAYSQYMHLVREQRETLDFMSALRSEDSRAAQGWGDMWRYVESSMHAERLRTYLEVFGQDQVFTLQSELLHSDPQTALDEVCDFLNVSRVRTGQPIQRNRGGGARSRRLADFQARPSAVKSMLRPLVPSSLRTSIGLRLLEANTTAKPEMPSDARICLERTFGSQAHELSELLGWEPSWPWLPAN